MDSSAFPLAWFKKPTLPGQHEAHLQPIAEKTRFGSSRVHWLGRLDGSVLGFRWRGGDGLIIVLLRRAANAGPIRAGEW